MKNSFWILAGLWLIVGCTPRISSTIDSRQLVANTIDLNQVTNDKIKVEVKGPSFTGEEVKFSLPTIVPGTYQISDFGQFVSDFQAFDSKGRSLDVVKDGMNTWVISSAEKLDKISYLVDDTFDSENDHGIYVMAGTNIEDDNFYLNLHGIIGYFQGMKSLPYELTVKHSPDLIETTSLRAEGNEDNTEDTFFASRYEEITDSPLMYAKANNAAFTVNGIDVTLAIYSPNGVHKAADLKDDLEKMMLAQTRFLEGFDTTDEYNILVYLFDPAKYPWNMFGALEHPSSTTVVFPETYGKEELAESMINHVISHEFFHIVTPLAIHSEEIHNFNYNEPDMSEHLWMYEGTTEYFAHLFQVQQGLIDENQFLSNMVSKIGSASGYKDDMSFTEMSKLILDEPYASNYGNVYQKGALISMCLDIIMREQSGGKKGWRDVMLDLSKKYGIHKAFNDDTIISEITTMTYPEIGTFFAEHVVTGVPIDYQEFFDKVGAKTVTAEVSTTYIIDPNNQPFLDGNAKGEIFFNRLNSGLAALGIQVGDVLTSIDGIALSLDNPPSIQEAIGKSFTWKEGDDISIGIIRDGEAQEMKGKAIKASFESESLVFSELPADSNQLITRGSWLGK